MRKLIFTLLLALPLSAAAEPLFMKDMVADTDFPPAWGVGLDFFTMKQDYAIADLQFNLPGVILPDPSDVDVNNEIQNYDIKADVWVTPFLNVFGVLGHLRNETAVDLSQAEIIGLDFSLPPLTFKSDGTVWGVGATFAYGSPNWFTSLTTTYTKVDLGGDFDSSTEAFTLQPRVGLIRNGWAFWVGAMYLDIDEHHSGMVELPFLGAVPFSVDLVASDEWNALLGTRYFFSRRASLSFEFGFGGRDQTLLNYNYRF